MHAEVNIDTRNTKCALHCLALYVYAVLHQREGRSSSSVLTARCYAYMGLWKPCLRGWSIFSAL